MRFSGAAFNLLYLNSKIVTILIFLSILFITNFQTTLSVIIFFGLTYFFIYKFVNNKIKINGRNITTSQKNKLRLLLILFLGLGNLLFLILKIIF